MSRILMLLNSQENRRLLSDWLGKYYQVFCPDSLFREPMVEIRKASREQILPDQDVAPLLDEPFDLCIMDGSALNQLWKWVRTRKEVEQPVFLPFLLVTSSRDVGIVTRHLWKSVDELIICPIKKVELQARVEILLRSRRLSLELKAANKRWQSEFLECQRVQDQREEACLALQSCQSQFGRLVESNIIGIAEADKNGNITEANDAFLQMVGYTREDLLSGNIRWDEMTPPEYRSLDEQAIEHVEKSGFCTPWEKEYIRKDGSRVSVLVGFVGLEDAKEGCVAFILDITERKQAETEIRLNLEKEKELAELRSRFVSIVSDEFRHPLNSILGSAQMLERYSSQWSQETKNKFFRRIKAAVRQMTELLDDVVVIKNAESGKLEFNPAPVELAKFCSALVKEMQLGASLNQTIVFQTRYANDFVTQGEFPHVWMDETLLRQILTNLLSNAIKYSAKGSTIYFDLIFLEREVIFQIKDNGIGIPPEDQQRLYESFHRAKNVGDIPGTGLGLAIVKQAVDLHCGKIAITSEVGLGTAFTVTLPLAISN